MTRANIKRPWSYSTMHTRSVCTTSFWVAFGRAKREIGGKNEFVQCQVRYLDWDCFAMLCRERDLKWISSENIFGHVWKKPENSSCTDWGTDSYICGIAGGKRVASFNWEDEYGRSKGSGAGHGTKSYGRCTLWNTEIEIHCCATWRIYSVNWGEMGKFYSCFIVEVFNEYQKIKYLECGVGDNNENPKEM